MKEGRQSFRLAKRVEIAQRRAKVAELYRANRTQKQIAAELRVSEFTVSEDIKALIAEWRGKAAVDMAAHMAVELECLNGVEAQAWESFEKSQQPKKVTSAGKRSDPPGGDSSSITVGVTTIQRPEGDPRFLWVILRCMEQRCKLLRLYSDRRVEVESKRPKTLEEFVAAHLNPPTHNGNGSKLKAVRPATVELDPKRLP